MSLKKKLFEYMNQDRIRHFWGIYDLQNKEANIRTLIAMSEGEISGYVMEIDERIIHLRGSADSAIPFLKSANPQVLHFNIEPAHLRAVRKFYNQFEPIDQATKGRVTIFLSMKVNANGFKPAEASNVREMNEKDEKEVGNLIMREPSRIKDLLQGVSYGIYKNGNLVAFAAAPHILEDLVIIRGVYTRPEFRGKGYASEVCSTITAQMINQGKEVFLYVSKDNLPALRVYKKLGFKETGHVFLSFSAKRK